MKNKILREICHLDSQMKYHEYIVQLLLSSNKSQTETPAATMPNKLHTHSTCSLNRRV